MDNDNINCPIDKYLAHTKLFKQLSEPCDWVFLGDSITNAGRWSELFTKKIVRNRGVDGDTVKGMLARLDSVLSMKPEMVFFLGGINDISLGRSPSVIMDSYKELVENLIKNEIKVVLQSIILTNNPEWNISVSKLNELIESYAKERDLVFVDLNEIFSEEGKIKGIATFDGVHLQADMYLLWRDKLASQVSI